MRNENAAMSEKAQRKLDSVCNCGCVGSCDLNHLMDDSALDSNTAPHCDDKVSFGSRQGVNESGSHKWTDLQLARKGEAMQGVVTHSVTHGGGVVYIEAPAPLEVSIFRVRSTFKSSWNRSLLPTSDT